METFVIRVFVPAGEERLELSGIVEHPGSGRSQPFRGGAGLVGVVLHQLGLGHASVQPGDQRTEEER